MLEAFRSAGFGLFTGVPCSMLTPLMDLFAAGAPVTGSAGPRYVPAANEGDAVAIACGAELGGLPGVVFFQNSGLGNAVNPLTSLAHTFRIPLLLVVTWRGDPGREPDEPQHRLMGAITPSLLEAMEIPWQRLPAEATELERALGRARAHMEAERRPYALVVPKGCVDGDRRPAGEPARGERAPAADRAPGATEEPLDQDACLAALAGATADDAVLTTTGFTGRALFAQGDRPNQLYMVGSMGCVSSLALGLALARPARRVVAVDGDGAFLMRLGALAAVARERPANLVHVLLDNGVHDSTGAQPTLVPAVDPVGVALACGYRGARAVDSADALAGELGRDEPGPRLVYARTRPRTDRKLPRPSIRPHEVAERLRAWVAG